MAARTTVGFEFALNLAHYAAHEDDGHTNRRLHGHTYQVKLFFEGDPDPKTGYAIDFEVAQTAIAAIKAKAEAASMNDIAGMGYSMETLSAWLARVAAETFARPIAAVELARPSIGMSCRYIPD